MGESGKDCVLPLAVFDVSLTLIAGWFCCTLLLLADGLAARAGVHGRQAPAHHGLAGVLRGGG